MGRRRKKKIEFVKVETNWKRLKELQKFCIQRFGSDVLVVFRQTKSVDPAWVSAQCNVYVCSTVI